jgi:dienelactone hydrolase
MIISGLLLVAGIVHPLAHVAAQDASGSASQSPAGALGDEAYRLLERFYDYDRGIPLEARVVGKEDLPDCTREKIVFRVKDSVVVAYLGIPKTGAPPHPCVIALHGLMSDKSTWWKSDAYAGSGNLSKALLGAGTAVFTADAQYHGERIADNGFESPGVMVFQRGWVLRARDMVVQTVIESRRAIDYLESRPEIDAKRVGVIGYSMGGVETFAATALDPRIKVGVACVPPSWPDPIVSSRSFARSLEGRPFLMLMGKQDQFYTVQQAQSLFDLIPGTKKEIVFYDSGHALPPEYATKAAAWLQDGLKSESAPKQGE